LVTHLEQFLLTESVIFTHRSPARPPV